MTLSRKDLLEQEYTETTDTTVTTVKTTELKPIVSTTVTTEQLSTGANSVDNALDATADLINEQFKSWYARQAYRLGADRYLALASDARRGRTPQKLFSYLLRQA